MWAVGATSNKRGFAPQNVGLRAGEVILHDSDARHYPHTQSGAFSWTKFVSGVRDDLFVDIIPNLQALGEFLGRPSSEYDMAPGTSSELLFWSELENALRTTAEKTWGGRPYINPTYLH